MVDIPEHLLLRSAEARAKALGISVEQALAEMKGESEPTVVAKEPEVEEVAAPAAKKLGLELVTPTFTHDHSWWAAEFLAECYM